MGLTERVNEELRQRQQGMIELLEGDVFDLIKGIQFVNAEFYFDRLLVDLFPNSDFAKYSDENTGWQTVADYLNQYDLNQEFAAEGTVLHPQRHNTAARLRNTLIRQTVEDAFGELTAFELRPGKTFTKEWIIDRFKRRDQEGYIGRTKIPREDIFLIALVFNLDYDQLLELLTKDFGHVGINYKDPYEVLLAFCCHAHTMVLANYVRLKDKYEEELCKNEHAAVPPAEYTTELYRAEFGKVESEADLMAYLLTLPSDAARWSPKKVFMNQYKEIKDTLNEFGIVDKVVDFLNIPLQNYESGFEAYSSALGLLTFNYEQLIKKAAHRELTNKKIRSRLLPKDVAHRRGTYAPIKKYFLDREKLSELIESEEETGNIDILREHLMIMLFYRFFFTGMWADVDEENMTENMRLAKVYSAFSDFANPFLREAGFNEIYLPSVIDRFLMFCLMTADPLQTMCEVISAV